MNGPMKPHPAQLRRRAVPRRARAGRPLAIGGDNAVMSSFLAAKVTESLPGGK
jgi:hypothetical protein